MPNPSIARTDQWPELPIEQWRDTCATLHLWTQVVGKIRLELTPWTNHSWHVPLYLTCRGLTTSPISYGERLFQIDFDFVDHELVVQVADGGRKTMPLSPMSVADFYKRLFDELGGLDISVRIHTTPSEIADATPFEEDHDHDSYDPEYVNRFWRVLLQADRVFKRFRAAFRGKCSPSHFFWGSFDLAVTRFSGKPAPPHPAGVPNMPDWVAREAYSHEVSSCGFWPGGSGSEAIFYSYAYPAPDGFGDAKVTPDAAHFSKQLGEFVLAYDDVRTSKSPDDALMAFLQSTYDAAADLAQWDRAFFDEPHRAAGGFA